MINKFDKTCNDIIISEGLKDFIKIFKRNDDIDEVIKTVRNFMQSFVKVAKFAYEKNIINFEKCSKLKAALEYIISDNFNDLVSSPNIEKNAKLIAKELRGIWPKIKGMNLLKGKIDADSLKKDLDTLKKVISSFITLFKLVIDFVNVCVSEYAKMKINPTDKMLIPGSSEDI